jgi:hypothetical protein
MDKTNKLHLVNRILFLLLIVFSSLTFISAEIQTLGFTKQNDCITLNQKYANSTYSNITTITYPSGSQSNLNILMNGSGGIWDYNFCNTSQIGIYEYCTRTDVDGVDTDVCLNFEVTPSGFGETLGFYIIMAILIGALILMGFSIKEPWFVILGGLGLMMLGIYSINYGIAGFRDMFMTWGLGLFEIGTGFILSVGSASQMLDD